MKVPYSEKHIVASQGIKSQSGFRIQASAHAYKILSDGLYSDKQTAVLREIGCNANDAHIAIGRPDLPIEVKLPTSLSPDMYIKDFGPGLSDEEVRGLYTTYFSSTKQDSNDFTGAFGLGSKSPFSYTDSFTVVSVKDGVERTYTATIDDEGVPLMALMNEKPATPEWPHGVLVGIAVPPADFKEFADKSREVFQWFTVKPNILGMSVDQYTPRFALDTPTFALTGFGTEGNACVIMGNVRYPLQTSKLGYSGDDAVDLVAKQLLTCGIHLRLPIGTVQVAASREQLQYDKASKPALVSALRAAALEFSRLVNAVATASAENDWALHISCQRFVKLFDVSLKKAVIAAIPLVQRNPLIASQAKLLFELTHAELPREAGCAYLEKPFVVQGYMRNVKAGTASRKTIYKGQFFRGAEPKPFLAGYLNDGFTIFVNDSKGSDKRMRTMVSHGTSETAIVVSPGTGATVDQAWAYAAMLSEKMGGAPLSAISTLPAPAKRPRGKRLEAGVKRRIVASATLVKFINICDIATSRKGLTPSLLPLNAVPDSAKYFLIKGEGSGSYSSYVLTRDFDGGADVDPLNCLNNQELRCFMKGANAVNELRKKQGLTTIDGFLLVSEFAVKRLKLAELGFKPFIVAVNEATLAPGIPDALEQATRGLPYMGMSDYGHPVDVMVHTLRNNGEKAALVRRVMKGKPMEQLIVDELPKVTGAENQLIRALVSSLNRRFLSLGLPVIQISEMKVTKEQVYEDFVQNFPLTGLFVRERFLEALENNKVGEVFLQQVLITPRDVELIHALKNQQQCDSVLLQAAA
jgi:hypothetical protein